MAEDETVLGTILIEMGGATTSIGIFHEGSLVFADSVPVGGMHVTNDIARGMSTIDCPCGTDENPVGQRPCHKHR